MDEINLLPQKFCGNFLYHLYLKAEMLLDVTSITLLLQDLHSPLAFFRCSAALFYCWLYVCSVEHLPQLQKPNKQQTKEKGI